MFWFLLGEAKCFQSRKLSAVASTESSSTTKVKQLKMTTATSSSSVMQLHALTPPSKNVSWRKNHQDFCPTQNLCNLSLNWCSTLFNIQIHSNIPSARWYGILKTTITMKKHWEQKHTKGDKGHDEDLGSWSEEDRQQHSLSRWSENISMDQFPAKLLLGILLEEEGTRQQMCESSLTNNLDVNNHQSLC